MQRLPKAFRCRRKKKTVEHSLCTSHFSEANPIFWVSFFIWIPGETTKAASDSFIHNSAAQNASETQIRACIPSCCISLSFQRGRYPFSSSSGLDSCMAHAWYTVKISSCVSETDCEDGKQTGRCQEFTLPPSATLPALSTKQCVCWLRN